MPEENDGPVRDRSRRIPLGLAEELVGAWSLVSYTLTDESGTVHHAMGEGASGLMLCTPDGYVSTQVQAADHRDDEHPEAGPGFLAHAGRWSLDSATIAVEPSVSLLPDGHGLAREHHVELDGDALTLSAEAPGADGRRQTAHLVWRRAAAEGTAD